MKDSYIPIEWVPPYTFEQLWYSFPRSDFVPINLLHRIIYQTPIRPILLRPTLSSLLRLKLQCSIFPSGFSKNLSLDVASYLQIFSLASFFNFLSVWASRRVRHQDNYHTRQFITHRISSVTRRLFQCAV